MRGTVTKNLRKLARVNTADKRKYYRNSVTKSITADDNRQYYQKLKKEYKNG